MFDEQANFHSDASQMMKRITPLDSNSKVYTRTWKIQFFCSRIPDPKFKHMEYACHKGKKPHKAPIVSERQA